MKVRNGFVSNSSSASYIILLPDDFGFDDIPKHIIDEYEDDVIVDIKKFIDKESYHEYDNKFFEEIQEIFENNVLFRYEGSSDAGELSIMRHKEINKLTKRGAKFKK